MTVRPLHDRILVKRIEGKENVKGAIIIPDSAKEKPTKGKVIAVGPGKLRENGERLAMAVARGDEVLYGRYGGSDIDVDGREVKILRESDILAKVVK